MLRSQQVSLTCGERHRDRQRQHQTWCSVLCCCRRQTLPVWPQPLGLLALLVLAAALAIGLGVGLGVGRGGSAPQPPVISMAVPPPPRNSSGGVIETARAPGTAPGAPPASDAASLPALTAAEPDIAPAPAVAPVPMLAPVPQRVPAPAPAQSPTQASGESYSLSAIALARGRSENDSGLQLASTIMCAIRLCLQGPSRHHRTAQIWRASRAPEIRTAWSFLQQL